MLDIIKKTGNGSGAHYLGLFLLTELKKIWLTISGLYFSVSIFNVCSLNVIQNFRNKSTFFLVLGTGVVAQLSTLTENGPKSPKWDNMKNFANYYSVR